MTTPVSARASRFLAGWIGLAFATACSFTPPGASGADPDGRPGPDTGAPTDDGGQIDAAPLTFPYPPSNFDPDPLEPMGEIVLGCGNAVFDSASLSFPEWCGQPEPTPVIVTQPGGPDAVVLAMGKLRIEPGTTLKLQGDRPIIFAVFDQATIEGTIDASADATASGPGGGGCAGDLDGTAGGGTGAGGGGGGFGTGGAVGATGEDGGNPGMGGNSTGTPELVPLRGGCAGGKGAAASPGPGGNGGGGGGGFQLSSLSTVTVSGVIGSAGGGGRGGIAHDGGGGGGSGGGILLEAVTLVLTENAKVTAHGGGGGEGGSLFADLPEDSGDPGSLDSATPAPGGDGGNANGGNGGNGGVGGVAPGNGLEGVDVPLNDGGGGGGGGGAVGRVRFNAMSSCNIDDRSLRSPVPTSSGATGCP